MYKLIIIDDEQKILEGLANLFPWEQIGFKVDGAFSSSLKALDYLLCNPVDVVMSDIEMPEMNGIELCRSLKEEEIETKVIFFSSYQNYEYFRSAIKYQVFDYLLKPIKYDELLSCFERVKEVLDQEHQVKTEKSKTYYEKIIENVIKYLEENYRNASLDEAASHVNLSSSYLSKIFKEKAGKGFAEYLLDIRMKKACEMLDDIRYKNYEIAYYVGYDNPKNFSRAFKMYYNMSPNEYRNRKKLQG